MTRGSFLGMCGVYLQDVGLVCEFASNLQIVGQRLHKSLAVIVYECLYRSASTPTPTDNTVEN